MPPHKPISAAGNRSAAAASAVFIVAVFLFAAAEGKSTIEPCANADACSALLGYALPAELKLAQVAALFDVDPLALLASNGRDFASLGSTDQILPAGLLLRVPAACSCAAGIRRSVSVRYVIRPSDSLSTVAGSVFSGLVSADQIREANSIADGEVVEPGTVVAVPFPCFCFNYTDNRLPAVYLSYVVRSGDTLSSVAAGFSTTVSDIMNVNAMSTPSISDGDIIAIALPACASSFSRDAADYGLIAAKGSSVISAGRCVQCSCGPSELDLYCSPTSLPVSCTSMQCPNSSLMLGAIAAQTSGGGCQVTSCSYAGLINSTITTKLITSLQPKCPVLNQIQAPSPHPSRQPATSPVPAPGPFLGPTGHGLGATRLGPAVAEPPSGKVNRGTMAIDLTWAVGAMVVVTAMSSFL